VAQSQASVTVSQASGNGGSSNRSGSGSGKGGGGAFEVWDLTALLALLMLSRGALPPGRSRKIAARRS